MNEDVDWTLLGKFLFGECTEGEETLVRERIIRREEDDVGEHLAWIDGQLAFEDAPFAEVVRRLERWYGLEVALEEGSSPPSGHLNARFAGDRSIADVMRVIGAAFGFKYHREGNRVPFSAAR